jgi:hypothetical protein
MVSGSCWRVPWPRQGPAAPCGGWRRVGVQAAGLAPGRAQGGSGGGRGCSLQPGETPPAQSTTASRAAARRMLQRAIAAVFVCCRWSARVCLCVLWLVWCAFVVRLRREALNVEPSVGCVGGRGSRLTRSSKSVLPASAPPPGLTRGCAPHNRKGSIGPVSRPLLRGCDSGKRARHGRTREIAARLLSTAMQQHDRGNYSRTHGGL